MLAFLTSAVPSFQLPAARSSLPRSRSSLPRSRSSTLAASMPDAFLEGAREALLAQEAMQEAAQQAAQAEARAAIDAQWESLAQSLPAETHEQPALTLYRDTNGWCPFCERVWLQLQVKGIPFDEVLIDLRDKPDWYKEIVPTTLVPAIKLADSGDVVWESRDIMDRLEADFPSKPLMAAEGSPERERAVAMMDSSTEIMQAGVRLAFGSRNQSVTDEERAAFRSDFEAALDNLDVQIEAGGGPFMTGESFSLADATYVPMLERWAVQLPLSHGLDIRPPNASVAPRWPALERWYGALAALPAYSGRVQGDEYSWAASVGTFQRMFSANSSAELSDAAKAVVKRADYAAAVALRSAPAASSADAAARTQAARKIIGNRDAIVADATSESAKSQPQLKRLAPREAPVVESVLQSAAERLVKAETRSSRDSLEELLDAEWAEAEMAMVRARAAKFVASRLCVPRDMGAEAGAALRATLLEIANEEEHLAWSRSGGLL